jgi:hypothetical protein
MIVYLPADAVPGPLRLYPTEARDTDPTEVALSSLGADAWAGEVVGLTGRYYPSITYAVNGTDTTVNLTHVDLPESATLLVSPESIAVLAGVGLPLNSAQREIITGAITDAQSDVRTYLGRVIVPTLYTETGRHDNGHGQWNLDPDNVPLLEVLAVTPETSDGTATGRFTITYRAGLDAKNDPDLSPIVRYVKAAALNSPEIILMWKAATRARGDVKSVTTDGQSISYDTPSLGGGGAAGSGSPGALPNLASLDYWRVAGRRVFQRETPYRPPWPHSSMNGRRW